MRLSIAVLAAGLSAACLAQDTGRMMTYYLAFLRKGPASGSGSEAEREQIQKAHLANISRLVGEGKIVLAGPFMDDGDLRGLFLYKVPAREEAGQLCAGDPAVKAGRLICEIHPWLGPKGITFKTD